MIEKLEHSLKAKSQYIKAIKAENNKLQKALDIAMEVIKFGCELNSYSVAVSIKYRCNEAKQKIQSILEGESE